MKRTKFTKSQIVKALKEAEGGRSVADISRELGINAQTFYNWKKKYSGIDGDQLKRLKGLRADYTPALKIWLAYFPYSEKLLKVFPS
jgi:putative transposase